VITTQAEFIRRLNALLRLAGPSTDLALMNNGAWWDLLNDLYWALFAERNRTGNELFEKAADRLGVKTAQEGLRKALPLLKKPDKDNASITQPGLPLEKQEVYIFGDNEGFYYRYLSKDFPTMVNSTLIYLLVESKVKPSDLLTCANQKCATVFVPLRKRSSSDRAFCSAGCANVVVAREYRERKSDELKAKERTRYVDKVRKKFPGKKVKVGTKARKPKTK
jgi:CGNR zinc finger